MTFLFQDILKKIIWGLLLQSWRFKQKISNKRFCVPLFEFCILLIIMKKFLLEVRNKPFKEVMPQYNKGE